MVQIEINGVSLDVEQGAMIIEAADKAGIKIPRFCYHKKLSIAANCRMCLIEVAGGRKPMPACATPVTDGMKVYTDSAVALEAQRAVMEFLLINHPLDCPICDQGGECELQDVSMGFGNDISQYTEGKRVVKDGNLGPLIATDMTRCIHCTRCVRFGQEIAGIPELGAMGRGEHTEIGTYIERTVDSELSGNMIDVCPVGALTSKPFRFKTRTWELKQYPSIAPHDCIGSNVYVHVKQNQVYRAVPKENEQVNEVWISDRDRFSYQGLNHPDRAQKPMVKENGQWREVAWEKALQFAVSGLMRGAAGGMEGIAALSHPSATLEEHFLLQHLMRGMGCQNVDHRVGEQDFRDQEALGLYPGLPFEINALEDFQSILLIGSNIRKEQPIAAHRVNKAFNNGAVIHAINPQQFQFVFNLQQEVISAQAQLDHDVAGVAKALDCQVPGLEIEMAELSPTKQHQEIAQSLREAGNKGVILLGALAQSHPHAAELRALARAIEEKTGAKVGTLTEGANAAGAWIAGAVPHRGAAGSRFSQPALNAQSMFTEQVHTYVLLGVEPELDCLNSQQAFAACEKANFVININSYFTDAMRSYSDVILPMSAFAETAGTFINAAGNWQSFEGAVSPVGDARPAWKILRVLGNLLHLADFDFNSAYEVRDFIKQKLDVMPNKTELPLYQSQGLSKSLADSGDKLILLAEKAIYAQDSQLRRAASLQQTEDARVSCCVRLNQHEAEQRSLADGDMVKAISNASSIILPVQTDNTIPNGVVAIARGVSGSAMLSVPYQVVELERAST